jgi:uncharacterized membrane protein
MHKGRLEAFSDAVVAIIMTIMVLELKVPHGERWSDLRSVVPVFLSYVLSFVILGIYWNNHHHMLQVIRKVNGPTLWANLHLLFWLCLMPVVTAWAGETGFAAWPVAAWGAVQLMSGVAYQTLAATLVALNGRDSLLGAAIGRDVKGKASLVLYAAAILLAFVHPWIACAIYVLVVVMWFLPEPRIERRIEH